MCCVMYGHSRLQLVVGLIRPLPRVAQVEGEAVGSPVGWLDGSLDGSPEG